MTDTADRGGCRALLRHAINGLRWKADHMVILGDFNSRSADPEVGSWHCFYALGSQEYPLDHADRRGEAHPPLYVVPPSNPVGMGTYFYEDSGRRGFQTIDFIAVDAGTKASAKSTILTAVAAKSVADTATNRPNLSDHLPVDGSVEI
jgi:endonuclease/exonuclease/phosphatase family metal-dependent hydrolase